MPLYEETKQLQEENNAKFSTDGVPDQSFINAFRERSRALKTVNVQNAQPLDVTPVQSETPKSWGRRLGSFYDPTVQQENFLAEQQSGLERMGYMLPRIATKALSEVAQLPGYLGGAIAWGTTGFDMEKVNLMVDNFWQKAIQNVEEDVKDRLPVYTADVVKNGNLFKNIMSTSFWANEGADGIGFLLGFLAPGAALRYAGFGTKMAKLIKPGTALAKAGKVGKATENLTAAGMKLAGNVDDVTSTLVNTLFESAAEGGETYRNVLADTGDRQRAAEAAVDVVQKNFGILGISNYIDQKWLFGNYGIIKDYARATKGLSKGSAFNRVFSTQLGEEGKILDAVAKRTTWNQIGNVSKTVAEGFLKEGFWEEGSQFAVSKHAEEDDGKDDDTFLGELTDIAKTYVDNLYDTDMQKSIFLGGVLGSTMAGVSTVREMKGEDKMLGNFHSLVKENNLDRYTSMSDLYEIDPETQQPKVVNGKYKIDENKAKEQLQRQFVKYIQGKQLVQLAKDGNIEAFEKIKDQRDLDYFLPFLQQQGGLDAAIYHINNLAETDMKWMQDEGVPINIEKTKQDLINKVIKFQKIYDKVSDTHDLNINVKYKKEDQDTYNNFSNLIKSLKLGAEASVRFSLDRIDILRNDLANYKISDNKVLSIASSEDNTSEKLVDDLNNSLKENKNSLSEADILSIKNTIKNIEGHITTAKRGRVRLGELYDNKILQKEYESYKTTLAPKESDVETASNITKAKKSKAAGLNPALAKLYNDSVIYEEFEGNQIRHSGEVALNFRDENGVLNTLTAQVIEPNSAGNLTLKGIKHETPTTNLTEQQIKEQEFAITETEDTGTHFLNSDGTLNYNGKTYKLEEEPIIVKTPMEAAEELRASVILGSIEEMIIGYQNGINTIEERIAKGIEYRTDIQTRLNKLLDKEQKSQEETGTALTKKSTERVQSVLKRRSRGENIKQVFLTSKELMDEIDNTDSLIEGLTTQKDLYQDKLNKLKSTLSDLRVGKDVYGSLKATFDNLTQMADNYNNLVTTGAESLESSKAYAKKLHSVLKGFHTSASRVLGIEDQVNEIRAREDMSLEDKDVMISDLIAVTFVNSTFTPEAYEQIATIQETITKIQGNLSQLNQDILELDKHTKTNMAIKDGLDKLVQLNQTIFAQFNKNYVALAKKLNILKVKSAPKAARIATPEDKLSDPNFRNKHEEFITNWESRQTHQFIPSLGENGIDNWLVSTGNQKQAQSNDDIARWYIFINNHAGKKDKNNRPLYQFKTFTFSQIGQLEPNNPIRQNLKFTTDKKGTQLPYDKITDKNNSIAQNDIKIVAFEQSGKLLLVGKNGELNSEDKSEMITNSLPLPSLKTIGGYDRFSVSKEKFKFYKKLGITEDKATPLQKAEFDKYINNILEQSRKSYEDLREGLKSGGQLILEINSINPGHKVLVNANNENARVEQDLLTATGLTNVKSLYKKIHAESRKNAPDDYNTVVSRNYSGTEHGIVNGFWYLRYNNRFELIKPKTFGETGSVDTITSLLQYVAKGSDPDNNVRQYLQQIIYSGVKKSTGEESPFRFYFDYEEGVKDFTGLVFGNNRISREDLANGTNIDALKSFLANKYWNFDKNLLDQNEFVEYVIHEGKVTPKTWEFEDGGYKGFLFSNNPEHENVTKGTVYIKPKAGNGLESAREPQYENQSISFVRVDKKAQSSTPTNPEQNLIGKKTEQASPEGEILIGGKPWKPAGSTLVPKAPKTQQTEVPKQTQATPQTEEIMIGGKPWRPAGSGSLVTKPVESNGLGDQTPARPLSNQQKLIPSKPLTADEYWNNELPEDRKKNYLNAVNGDLNNAKRNAYASYLRALKEDNELSREANLYDQYKLENLDDAKAWLKETFPNIPVEIIDGLIDGKDWGRLTKDATILLSSIAEIGTGYHEGFHVFSQLVLSDDTRINLYNEVRSRTRKELTDKQAEEYLAEEFRSYMISPESYTFDKTESNKKNFFRKLLDLILEFLHIGKDNYNIEKVFETLRDGSFNVYAKQLPNSYSREIDRTRVPGLTDKETLVFTRDINYRFFDTLFDPLTTYSDTHLLNINTDKFSEDIYNDIYDQYTNLAKKYGSESFYAKILEHFENMKEEHKRFLRQYNIDTRNIIEDIKDEDEDEENELDKSSYAYRDNLGIDLIELIDNPVRMLIAGLPSITKDSKLLSDLTEYKTRSTVRFNRIMRLLNENLANLGVDFNTYANKLDELSYSYPELKVLMDRLRIGQDSVSKSTLILRNQFVRVFAHHMNTPLMTNYKPNGIKNNFDARDQDRSRLIRTKWQNNAISAVGYKSSLINRNSRGAYVVNTKGVQDAIKNANLLKAESRERLNDYLQILRRLGITITQNNNDVYDYKTIANYITRLSEEISARQKNILGDRVQIFKGFWTREQVAKETNKVFLFGDNTEDRTKTNHIPYKTQAVIRGLSNAIGIDTKKNRGTNYTSYLTDNDYKWFRSHVEQQIYKAIKSGKIIVIPEDGIGTGKAMLKEKAPKLFEYLQSVLSELSQLNKTTVTKELLVSDLFNANVVENQKETKALVDLAKKYFLNDTDLSFYNQDGNREYPINLHSHTTDLIDLLNRVTYDPETDSLIYPREAEYLKAWDGKSGNLYNGYSYWRDHQKTGGKLKVVDLKGIVDQFNNKNSSRISNTTFGDYKSITFNALLHGIYIQLRSADRRRELGFMLTDKDGNPDKINYNINRNTFKKRMDGYLRDELVTSFALLLESRAGSTAWGNDLQNYSKNARELRTFKFLYDRSLITPTKNIMSLERFIDNSPITDTRDTVVKARELVDNYITKYQDHIDKSFDAYINRMAELTRQSLVEDKVIIEIKSKNDEFIGANPVGLDKEILTKMGIGTVGEYGISEKNLNKIILFANYTSFVGNQEQLKYIMGDPAMWLNTTDFHKRVNGATSPKNKLADSLDIQQAMDELYPRFDTKSRNDSVDIVVIKDIYTSNSDLKDLYKEYANNNGSDAESYALLDEYRDIMIRNGLWYNNHEKTYQFEMQKFALRLLNLKNSGRKHPFLKKINDSMFTDPEGIFYEHTKGVIPTTPMFEGKELSETELGVLTIQKPQGFGHIVESVGLNTPQFFKTSTAPLFPSSFSDDSKMLDVMLHMMNKGQGILAFESSMKGEVISIQPLFDTKNKTPKAGYNSQQLRYADFGLQLDISEEEKGEVTVSTQRTRLEFIDIFDNGNLTGHQDLATLKDEYDQLTNAIIAEERKTLLNNLGLTYNENTNTYTLSDEDSIKKFKERLIGAFNFSLLPYNIIDGMDLALDSAEKVFDMTVNRRKIEEVLTAMIRKNIISRKTKGDMLVQESSVLYDDNLSFYKKSGDTVIPMEIAISLPLDLVPVMKRVGGLDKLNEAIKSNDTKLLGEDFFRILTIPMNRIPGQSLSSLDVGKVKYFLPYYHGNKVILPSEITTKTGSDFDVDKMTSYFHYYDVKDGYLHYYKSPETNLEGKKNRLNEIAISATLHPSRFNELVKPLTSKTVKDLTNKYVKKINKTDLEEEAYSTLGTQQNKWQNLVSWWYNMQKGYEFFSAKKGTAIAAVHNSGNALSQKHPVRMKAIVPLYFKGQKLSQDQYYGTGFVEDADGYTTSRNFGEFLSAFVDVVKDPFIFDLTDSNTFNTIAFLNRYGNKAGVGLETIVAFMTQPAVREYLKVRRENSAKFLSFKDRLNFEKQYEETVNRLRKQSLPTEYDPSIPVVYKATIASHLNDLLSVPLDDEYEKNEALKQLNISLNNNNYYQEFSKKDLQSNEIRSDFKKQVQILDNFMTYQILAQKLISLNLLLRPDARSSMERHLSSIEAGMSIPMAHLVNTDLFNYEDILQTIGGVTSTDGKTRYPKTLITEFFGTQANMDKYFGELFLTQKDPVVNEFFNGVIYPYFSDPSKWKKKKEIDRAIIDVESDFITFIIADSLGKKSFKEMTKLYHDLFMGDNSVPKELLKLKNTIQGNVALNELDPKISERISKTRAIAETDNISLFNKSFNVQELDAIESDLYALGIQPNEVNKRFVYNLMLHSVFQSGFNNAANSYIGIVPNRLFIDIAEQAVSKFVALPDETKMLKLQSFYDQFFRNNASNTKIVPRHPWMTRASKKVRYWFPMQYEDKKNFYKNYDYISFNYYTHNPRPYFKAGTNPPTDVVLYRRIPGEDNIFEVVSKQGDGSRMKEYYPELSTKDLDNVSLLEGNRYNARQLDVQYEEEEQQFVPDESVTDDELETLEDMYYFDPSKLSGSDFTYLPEGKKNLYYSKLGRQAPLHRALRMIEENSTNPGHIKLARVLRGSIKTAIPFQISKKAFEESIDPETGIPEAVGVYDPIERKAYVYESLDDTGFEVATLHEAMHALTYDELEKNPNFKERIQKIADHAYNQILKTGKNRDIIQSGYDLFTDPHEFISHAFTNGKFQNILAQLEAENPELVAENSKKISIFKEFMNELLGLIRKYFNMVFGITHAEYNNDLQVMESTLQDLIVTVEEYTLKDLEQKKSDNIINELLGNEDELITDDIKVINKSELGKDPTTTEFDQLYPEYNYLTESEKEAFNTMVEQGKVQLACRI